MSRSSGAQPGFLGRGPRANLGQAAEVTELRAFERPAAVAEATFESVPFQLDTGVIAELQDHS